MRRLQHVATRFCIIPRSCVGGEMHTAQSRRITSYLFLFTMLWATVLRSAQLTAQENDNHAVAIKGATILSMTHGTIENGTVVIQNGKIQAVGTNVDIPSSAEVIDAKGEFVLPGLVDPHSHLGVYSLPAVQANSDGNEMSGDIEAQVRSEDAINTDDPEIARAVSGGVTTVQILPGSGNNIGGWATVVKLNGGQRLDEIKFPGAPPSMKWAWGENPKRVYGTRNEAPSTLMG